MAVKAGDENRLGVPLLQPAGDNPHHARVPAIAADKQEGIVALHDGYGVGGFEDMRLDGLTLAVMAVELDCEPIGFRGIVGGKQPRAEVAAPDAAACIDAGTEDEAQVEGRKRRRGGGEPRQSGEAWPFQPFELAQTLAHKGAVDSGERHHVGDGGERHQVELVEEVRLVDRLALNQPFRASALHTPETERAAPRRTPMPRNHPARSIHTGEGQRIVSTAWWSARSRQGAAARHP